MKEILTATISHKILHNLFSNHADLPMIKFDKQLNYQQINPAAQKIIAYRATMSFDDVEVTDLQLMLSKKNTESLINSDELDNIKIKLHLNDKFYLDMKASVIPVMTKAGQIDSVYIILNSKEPLLDKIDSLKEIINTVPVSIFLKAKNGKFILCNKSFVNLFGIDSSSAVIGKTDFELPWKEYAEEIRKNDLEVELTRKKISREERLKNKQGKLITLTTIKAPLCDEENNIVGIIGIAVDISKEKRYVQQLLDMVPCGIYTKDRNGRIIICNKFSADLLGLKSTDDIIGKTDFEMPWKNNALMISTYDNEVMRENKPITKEEYIAFKDGSLGVYLSTKAPLYDSSGEIIGIIGTSFDITERKKLEKETLLAKEVAEEANRQKTQFMKNMNHDMRTPLVGVIGRLGQLLEDELLHQKRDTFSEMSGSLEGLLDILNTILEFNQTGEGAPKVYAVTSLHHMISSTIALYKSAAVDKKISLTSKIDKSIPEWLMIDNFRVKHSLNNLIGNAIKFTDEGGEVSITVKEGERTNDKIKLQFSVKDTGIGFPEKEKDNIFDKYNKLNRSDSGKYPGTGLGLYAVKQYISELEGTIDVKSVVGKGSTFCITLVVDIAKPRAAAKSLLDNPSTDEIELDKNSATSFNVLFIEDNIINQEVGLHALKKLHFKADLAADVQSALQKLNTNVYDIILSDIGLPDGTGNEIVEAVKKNSSHLNFKSIFIALTADKTKETHTEAKMSGFSEVLDKPFPVPLFKVILKKYFPSLIVEQNASSDKNNLKHKKNVSANNKEKKDDPEQTLNKDILDWDKCINFNPENSDITKHVIEMMINAFSSDKIRLEEHKQQNNLEESRKLIHRLNGSYSHFSVKGLNDAICRLDHAAKDTEQLSLLENLYQNVYVEMDKVQHEYEHLRKSKNW